MVARNGGSALGAVSWSSVLVSNLVTVFIMLSFVMTVPILAQYKCPITKELGTLGAEKIRSDGPQCGEAYGGDLFSLDWTV